MAKVVVHHIDEYMLALQSKELTSKESCSVWFYIDRLKYAESMPKGAGRTRTINLACKELNVLLGFEPKPEIVVPKTGAKVYAFLCEHTGENAPTRRTPCRLFEENDEALLTIMVPRCRYWDDDGIVQVNLWEKRYVTIPGWMDPTTYPNQDITLRWYLGFGANIDWPESWYKKLTAMSQENQFATIRLLNQKSFRGPKRKEIYDRVVAWLNDEGELGKWDIINLRNQYIDLECSRCSQRLYWSR